MSLVPSICPAHGGFCGGNSLGIETEAASQWLSILNEIANIVDPHLGEESPDWREDVVLAVRNKIANLESEATKLRRDLEYAHQRIRNADKSLQGHIRSRYRTGDELPEWLGRAAANVHFLAMDEEAESETG